MKEGCVYAMGRLLDMAREQDVRCDIRHEDGTLMVKVFLELQKKLPFNLLRNIRNEVCVKQALIMFQGIQTGIILKGVKESYVV